MTRRGVPKLVNTTLNYKRPDPFTSHSDCGNMRVSNHDVFIVTYENDIADIDKSNCGY